ncbi:MAG: long-chain-acyl-CoA synthetase [Henriciella sp.]|uniref:long-chain-acyl-CoA synthetase n=1 Tax=Henriciella sp. TaxID=1968823 RepID=UPI003C73192C
MELLNVMKREWAAVSVLSKVKKWLDPIEKEPNVLVADDLEDCFEKYASRTAVHFEGRDWTYDDIDKLANRIAYWGLIKGLHRGDTVALLMENRPEYIAVWYGLSKIGVVTALVNTTLVGKSLAHSIDIANARMVITGEDHDKAIGSLPPKMRDTLQVWTFGGKKGRDFMQALSAHSDTRPAPSCRSRLGSDAPCLFIYTSGTTGMPKAARMSNAKVRTMLRTFIAPCGAGADDRTYVTLPMYHATGGLCAVGLALQTGGAVILRRRFSASAFWQECADTKATIIAYIGELCRYLMNQPESDADRKHKVRVALGNGLGSDIWAAFEERFGLKKIVEFYGSTEGNVKFMNYDGTPGACGRVPAIARKRYSHVAFVKFDVDTQMPVRDEAGHCVRVSTNETGEVLGRLGEDGSTRFEGYQDEAASEQKILRDVFEEGDAWYRTGDLMRMDKHGYVYFVDRVGDTFRWKGENVSTSQVAEALSKIPGVTTANVYGVAVPGADGKAGMASVTTNGYLDYKDVLDRLAAHLPRHAIPVFIREQQEATTTGTFKYRKVDLQKEGFNPKKVKDPVWYVDPETGRYRQMTPEDYQKVANGGRF